MRTARSGSGRGLLLSAAVLGIGLGGFFDGILLHQVLQWHHLLSLVPGEAFRDIGTQILADGLFHVLMYLVTAAGLWMLWRRRSALSEAGAAARVAGGAILGFAVWNVVDVAFFHWTLGIHRIRIDVPDPMLYDLGWLAAFGVVPLPIALAVLKRGGGGGGRAAGATLALLALLAMPLAALPVPGSDAALVVLAPGAPAAPALNAAIAADARILWMDAPRGLIAVSLPADARPSFYRAGAIFVTRSPAIAGCLAAARA